MNPNDDDRSARSQVTLRLDRDLLDSIDKLARDEGVDRTELTRRLLTDGLGRRRVDAAVGDYAAGRRSAWSAAQQANVALYEMLDRIAEEGVPYRVDPEALDRLRAAGGPPPSGTSLPAQSRPARSTADDEAEIAALRETHQPRVVRLLFVGESSPAGGTHFYRANSILYRATREAFANAFDMADPPDGEAFLRWFGELGCWLIDLADHPVDRTSAIERGRAVRAGVPSLVRLLAHVKPVRLLVVLRRIAPAVRLAAREAGFDDRRIEVLPFPTRQWRSPYVDQLAGILREELSGGDFVSPRRAIAETSPGYGPTRLHEVMVDVLRDHGRGWMKASAIARQIAAEDRWRRPSDGDHPPGSQISARAGKYPHLFQTSDLGIRLRDEESSA